MKFKRLILSLAIAASLTGCASIPEGSGSNPNDPFETMNRHTTAFNDALDEYVASPITKAYKTVFPDVVQEGISRVFRNLGEPSNMVNNLLQGKFEAALISLSRFVINSTVGLGGVFDVAACEPEMTVKEEDFGQTLATWGIPSGPYLVLPFLGPSSLRDGPAIFVDYMMSPVTYADSGLFNKWSYANNPYLKWSATGLELINMRASLSDALDVVKNSIDPYVMTREAYFSQRENVIYDGNPPFKFAKDEFEEEE